MKETIRDKSRLIIGYVETKPNGDKVVTNFGGMILGYYRKSMDATTDFYGRILYYGDMASSLLKNS